MPSATAARPSVAEFEQEIIIDRAMAYRWLLKYGPKARLEDVLRAEGFIPAAQSKRVRGSRC